jgi:hypothetical protein
MSSAPGPNDLDAYGREVFQRSNLVISDGVKIIARNGGSIESGSGASTVFSSSISTIVKLTQAEYDAISSPDATTLYVIVG